ncbi:TetR/AcrR family transcriptional regulator [Rhodococcus rhodnii]|uniref:Transcriptional regulator n=2 Tax=Rhodococcus rhodnii TaxID=38312 RepID=R7WIV6_9NOCA|nr:TetR/AcrR family transcriptional regulator [Rhodococcus rhodnii]EOM75138.1 transcriptional regulator [Rhodococcus rhodnii LMG 5362]TXG89383.1 TetR/AcrR family transcriptional regulator [Rhodococcus rhodnii]
MTEAGGRRTGERTRGAILDAAGRAFGSRPYAEITLKEIAEDAGVSAPLIIKYFGSKEKLFEAVVDFRGAADLVFSVPRDRLGEHIVRLFAQPREPYKPLSTSILYMSATSEDSVAKLRGNYSAQMIDVLAGLLDGDDTRLRAELVMSMVTGLAVMRRRMLAEHATGAVDEVVARYAPLVQQLIDTP